jgi:curved DNA-binding protein CbpA
MARKLHPDKGGDPEAFKVMYAAYRKLLTIAKE